MHGKYAHELQSGEQYEPLEFAVTPDLNQQFLYAVEDFNPLYLEGRDGNPPLVHPVLLMHMSPRTRSPSYRQAPGMGSAFARDRSTYMNPGLRRIEISRDVDDRQHVRAARQDLPGLRRADRGRERQADPAQGALFDLLQPRQSEDLRAGRQK